MSSGKPWTIAAPDQLRRTHNNEYPTMRRPAPPCHLYDICPQSQTIAVDTEYAGIHTLTVQAATRTAPGTIALLIYHSPEVPEPPADFYPFLMQQLSCYEKFFSEVSFRPVQIIPQHISPLCLQQDLRVLPAVDRYYWDEGHKLLDSFDFANRPTNIIIERCKGYRHIQVPPIHITLVGHTLIADFLRIHSAEFFGQLNRSDPRNRIVIEQRRFPRLVGIRGIHRSNAPFVEFLARGEELYAAQVDYRDIAKIVNGASLQALSETFLGIGKSTLISGRDKADMRRTFHERPREAYAYAATDAINTLLIYERMQHADSEMYRNLGIPEERIPSMRPTLGGRVSTLLTTKIREGGTAESQELASGAAIQALVGKGGIALFNAHPGASRYGPQTAAVHGGLLLSRSPTRLWHASPANMIDVDTGCYPSIAAGLNAYLGRPVIFEPGSTTMSLREAVTLSSNIADDDAWLIKVSGPIPANQNVLVPSSDRALTSANYRQHLRVGKRQLQQRQAVHLEELQDPSLKTSRGTRIFSMYVGAGIVTRAIWLMIQSMPQPLREQYENLSADTIMFYPRLLVASSGREFDELVKKHFNAQQPWCSQLDLEHWEIRTREKLDHEYVSLRFPLGDVVAEMLRLRHEAQQRNDAGQDAAWKETANTVYGVLASPLMQVHNIMAANMITATARAAVFGIGMALNSIQINTDGCSARRDQIPACTFEECLARMPDYPLRRAEDDDGIPFLDPATVPLDDEAFAAWYPAQLKRFFGGANLDDVYARLDLRLKRHGADKRPYFDALACDGVANYVKLNGTPTGHTDVDTAMRGFGRESKKVLVPMITTMYSQDLCESLLPITEDSSLLSLTRAAQKAHQQLNGHADEAVRLPMGLEARSVRTYSPIKSSAFVFQTPEQHAACIRHMQRFRARHGCGLEILALRRDYGDRRCGSLQDIVQAIYDLIRTGGGKNLTKEMNLQKLGSAAPGVVQQRKYDVEARKNEADSDLARLMAIDDINASLPGPFLFVTPELLQRLVDT